MVENDAAATGDGGATGAGVSSGQADGAGTRRRRGPAEVQEVIDELAQETKRITLLDCVEQQVKDRFHVSRIMFGFAIADDKKTQNLVEQEFKDWREKQERRVELTGVLIFTAQGALQFLEGPTELLFGAVELFQSLTIDAQPPAPMRPAMISQLRIIHFTELHGVRSSASWCSYVHGGKLQGGTQVQLEESACADYVYKVYQKFVLMCLRVREQAGDDEDEPDGSAIHAMFKKLPPDMMPSVDEVHTLLSKNTADYFFNYAEFEKVFMAPFQLVLHSELLWPMSPALVY